MICDHELKTGIQVKSKDPKYGVKIIFTQVQLSYPCFTKPNKLSKNFGGAFISPKKCLTSKMKKTLSGIAEYVIKYDQLLKDKGASEADRQRIAKVWLALTNKDGAFLKDGDKMFLKDGDPGFNPKKKTIKPESQGAWIFRSKASAKEENGVQVSSMKLDFKDSDANEVAMAQVQSEFYGGAIINVSLTVKAYHFGGNFGITTYFQGAQKLIDSTPFGDGHSEFEADDSFADYDGGVEMGVDTQ